MRNICKLSIILVIITNFWGGIHSFANGNTSTHNDSYKQVFDCIQTSNWVDAQNLANKLGDKALLKIVLSQAFLDTSYTKSTFHEIVKFLKENPKWPQNNLLKSRAENLIDDTVSDAEIYNWFKIHRPITGGGYKYYAFAAAQILTDPNKLAPVIKKGWVYGSFSQEQQVDFYKKFKKFLNKNDNIKRIDNLIWKGSTVLAKNSLNLVEAGYKKAFEAHMAFTGMKKEAKQLFRNVPKEYYTPGLVYQYVSAKKNELPKSTEIASLINAVKHYGMHGDDFWKVQCYLAREYIENKRFNDAYIISSIHFAESSANISDAEFLSGWLALRFLNKPQLAIKHFKKFAQVVKTPISISRGMYWLGRAYAKNGQKEEARKLYARAAHQFGYTFYGQVATLEIGANKLRLPPKVTTTHKKDYNIKNKDILRAANLVSKYGSSSLAKVYLDDLVNSAEEEQEILAIALATKTPNVHHKVWLSRTAMQKHVFLDHYSFPDPYKIDHLPTEKALTYSIIRQESSFEKSVIAPDKGMGLMQLMEPTACDTAKKLAIKCNLKNLTNDAYYNLTLGSHYLADMLQQHKNYYVLAIAAYNAGPHRVKKWLDLYGDLREFKDFHQAIDWIESIPFSVTRNYVQRVLENLQIYRAILYKDGKFKLKQDLLGKA